MSVRTRASAALAAAALTAAACVALAPQASAGNLLRVNYDVSGTSYIAKPGSTVTLGPAVLHTALRPSGAFTGNLKLPSTTASFKIIGLLPVTADVNFVTASRVKGSLSASGTVVSATAKYYINLNNVKVAGIPTFVGSSCQTAEAVSIPASGPFNILQGGTLTGTYSIGNFANCGLTTSLINLLVPGDGNTATLTLSNPVRVGH